MKAAMSPLMLAGLQTAGLLFSSHSQDEACGNIGGLETQQRILCPHALASPACCQAERSEQVEAALCRCEIAAHAKAAFYQWRPVCTGMTLWVMQQAWRRNYFSKTGNAFLQGAEIGH